MTEKMTIEKAREYVKNQDQYFGDLGHAWDHVLWKARGFIEGWESRQAEMEELKKKIKELENRPTGGEIYPMGTTGLFTDRMGNVYDRQR